MKRFWRRWYEATGGDRYLRRRPLVLINGLADHPESWYRNLRYWRRHFDVHTPALLAYNGQSLHQRIESGEPITIDYLVERLRQYLDEFVQTPPYHLLANSMGGKIAVEFAARYPDRVDRLVLLCPSGLADEERLPVVEGVRRNDIQGLVQSVFSDPGHADPALLPYYKQRFADRRWRSGALRAIRGTMEHTVRERIAEVTRPTLLVVGDEDRIVDPAQSLAAGRKLRDGQIVVLKGCGHAPQIERARTVNRLVVQFLSSPHPGAMEANSTLAESFPEAAAAAYA